MPFARSVVLVTTLFCSQLVAGAPRESILNYLDSSADAYAGLAQQIWDYAELGYLEQQSSALLQQTLAQEGFDIETGVADIPTAFVASYGSGEPVIALLAEFDALPGISQTNSPQREIREDSNSGHACGHHLFGAGSVAAAVAIKQWMAEHDIAGTLRLYGTPAEEGGSGKVYMVRAGLFDDVDSVLVWHPYDRNTANTLSTLANKSAKFRFTGISSHAAMAPERGRSALDGVEAMNFMVNLMREHVPQETRMHYVITSGGSAPNVVPDFAEVFYYVRHPQAETLKTLWSRVLATAEAAALGTGTQVEAEVIHGNHSLLPNATLSQLMHKNLEQVGGVNYSPAEQAFAQEITRTLNLESPLLGTESKIQPFTQELSMGSTDVGDVSWQVPTAEVRSATWVPGTSAHTWQAIAAGGTSIGAKGMLVAAKTMALSAADLFEQPDVIAAAKREFEERRGTDFTYEALLGDRQPPLDYRMGVN